MLNEISIEIIRKCPNNCLHCSSTSNKFCDEIIDYEKFKSVVDDAKKLGARTICLSGGEPFLHPNIVELTSYVKQKGLNCYIYTSGIALDGGMEHSPLSKNLLKDIAGKVTKLIFNIEASNELTYNKIMGTVGCFELMKESVQEAVNMHIISEAHFVPMKININEIKSTIRLCEKLGISKISFLRLVLHGRALSNKETIMLSNIELKFLIKELQILRNESDINIRLGTPLSNIYEQYECEAATGKVNIKYDGYVYPCEVFKNDSVDFTVQGYYPDNIHEKGFQDIYMNSEYLKYVRSLVKNFSCNNCESCVGQYLIANSLKGGYLIGK